MSHPAGGAVVGIGRGDSALAHIGRAPVRVAAFERYLKAVQGYLSGRSVTFDELDFDDRLAAKLDTIAYEVVCDVESRVPRRYR